MVLKHLTITKKFEKIQKIEIILERYDIILYYVTLGNHKLSKEKKGRKTMHRYLESYNGYNVHTDC